jgi:hypothetical protein
MPPVSGLHTYRFPLTGDVYVGPWENGLMHGSCGRYLEHATGNTYEGSFVQGMRHGRGTLITGAKDLVYDGT